MIRVVVAAVSDVARAGLSALVTALADVEIVARVADSDALAHSLRADEPDGVLIDAGGHGSDSAARFLSALADTPRGPAVVVFSDEPLDGTPSLHDRSHGSAVLPRRADAAEIGAAMRAAAAGLIVRHPALEEKVLPLASRSGRDGDVLTPREIEVLGMLAAGLPNKAIAKRLGVSAHTVKFHVGSIMSKLHASSRTEAVTDGIRRGLIFI